VSQFIYLDFPLPVPLLSALVFALLGAALLMARPSHPLMAVIMRIAPGGQMLRHLLPQTLFLLLAFSLLLNWGMTHGWIVPELVLPTLTLINGVIVLFIFWGSASRLDSEYGERTRNAQKLAETSALLNAVSESTSDPIFVKNRQGLMIFANPATLHKLGKTWEETMYRSSRELFLVQEEADTVDRDDRRVMASGKPEKLEQTLHLPEGVVTFQTAKVPWFGKDGSVQGVIGISTDITERKQAEDELRQRESQLEKTVIQRTALLRELTNHLETVREEEKRAIARELHDNMGASLTALSMHLEGVYQILPPDENGRSQDPHAGADEVAGGHHAAHPDRAAAQYAGPVRPEGGHLRNSWTSCTSVPASPATPACPMRTWRSATRWKSPSTACCRKCSTTSPSMPRQARST
jgi:PAS domain S-box-containing protein